MGSVEARADRDVSLRAVERACGELRRGDLVLVRPDAGPALLVQAAETATGSRLERMRSLVDGPISVVITRQRAAALGLDSDGDGVVEIALSQTVEADFVRAVADPCRRLDATALASLPRRTIPSASRDGAAQATRLLKLARLLPAVLTMPVDRPLGTDRLVRTTDILSVSAFDIDRHEGHAARSLRRVAEARVPLEGAEDTTVISFRPTDGGREHLAIVIGKPDPLQPVLIRLHSECFTGDLLGSLRCDCGDQLRGAIAEIARAGSGVLLYLAQEGRGIGLVNKLRAYRLQDEDFDTVDANEMLGYGADERVYLPAAEMLRQLGFTRVRVMTNNPDKLDQLGSLGIEVVDRVPHAFPANGHNEFYLATKKARSGHLL